MKIVLHQANFRSLFGLVCSASTLSQWSHSSIITDDGKWYDTTFKRGYSGLREIEPARKVRVFGLPDHILSSEDLADIVGIRYDYIGLLLWLFNIHSTNRMYCYESALLAIKKVGIEVITGQASPHKIINALKGFNSRYCLEGEIL